jgi:hypothetical protein
MSFHLQWNPIHPFRCFGGNLFKCLSESHENLSHTSVESK